MNVYKPEIIQKIINIHMQAALSSFELTRLREGRVSSSRIQKKYQKLEKIITRISDDIQHQDIRPIIPLAIQLLKEAGFSIDVDGTPFKNFCRKLQKARVEMWQVEQKRVMGDYSDDPKKLFPVPYQTTSSSSLYRGP